MPFFDTSFELFDDLLKEIVLTGDSLTIPRKRTTMVITTSRLVWYRYWIVSAKRFIAVISDHQSIEDKLAGVKIKGDYNT
ncbi:hypothetical protein [uncultured Limosilactobacillus sp.]|uniref:hypothetical protein n=1 Tax=uncultured Limosilactobacillus sp. TaxID=2837629 RepID=UPI0026014312|nr:hypothetical protein [uncultured Limosilactobacillus sp.]